MKWLDFVKHYVENNKNNNDFIKLPRMVQDMVRYHANILDCREYSGLQTPILQIISGTPYTCQDIEFGIKYLTNMGIRSFVVAENSTYCLDLIALILDVSNIGNFGISCSISDSYHKEITSKYGTVNHLTGVIVKMKKRKSI